MSLVVPGVQVSVIQEIVPPQLAPSGVLGLIGLTEKALNQVVRVSSWPRFLEVCGPATAYSLPEAKVALSNGVYQLAVVSLTGPDTTAVSAKAQAFVLTEIQVKAKVQNKPSADSMLTYDNSTKTLKWHNKTKEVSDMAARQVMTSLAISDLSGDPEGLTFSANALSSPTEFVSADQLPNSDAKLTIPSQGSSLVWLKVQDKLFDFIHLCNTGPAPITISLTNVDSKTGLITATLTAPTDTPDTPQPTAQGADALEALMELAPKISTIILQPSISRIGSGEGKGLKPPCSFLCLDVVGIEAKAPGAWANNFRVSLSRSPNGSGADKLDMEIFPSEVAMRAKQPLETFRGRTVVDINRDSKLISLLPSLSAQTKGISTLQACVLLQGKDASVEAYTKALDKLNSETDVDLVLASVPFAMAESDHLRIYDAIKSHCERASANSHGRLGFGQLPPEPIKPADWSSRLNSDRFVLVAPQGTAAAVAGRVGSLNYWESPTFKSMSGLTELNPTLAYEYQEQLLKANVLPVSFRLGRGVIMVRGITTNGDQISVRRIADRAVRGVQLIGELFIGTLNNEDGRNALRQKIMEFLMQMKKDGALVPSADGKSPPFQIDVYSSEDDFAKGIVRVQLAVRPVRAIDYIYATILVQA